MEFPQRKYGTFSVVSMVKNLTVLTITLYFLAMIFLISPFIAIVMVMICSLLTYYVNFGLWVFALSVVLLTIPLVTLLDT